MAILTALGDDALASLVSAYDLGVLQGARGIEAGTVNTSYRLDLERGPFFLRLYEEQATEGAEAEARLLQHLAAHGVPTPAPVVGRDGKLVRTVAGKPAALFPWVMGDMLCLPAVTPSAGREVGAALARMHLVGEPPFGAAALGPGRFGPADLDRRCDRVARSTDPAARALSETLREEVGAVAGSRRVDLPTGLVHGDLFRDNVLWHEGRISALLDFESAHRGPFAYDLAVTILSWSFRAAFDHGIGRAIVAGYREVRELQASERDGLHAEALFAALRFTITRITDEAIRVGKKWERFVARREALVRLGPGGLSEALGL